ncbi:hypothetical protein EZS27_014670 [termite gut metagenome]|uniref:Uncharacterized protein n=1 Tax=termite gut metagenome TaxID=433724 RepID=A0A5J4RVM8_9ZZZZ
MTVIVLRLPFDLAFFDINFGVCVRLEHTFNHLRLLNIPIQIMGKIQT